jgi:TRAP-type C4-dicarboxylate transport system permease small subunit
MTTALPTDSDLMKSAEATLMQSAPLDAGIERRAGTIERVAYGLAALGVVALLLIAISTVVDVLGRAFFNAPLFGLNELSPLLIAIAVIACIPVGLSRGVGLSIDIVGAHVPASVKSHLESIGGFATLLFFCILAWRVGVVAHDFEAARRTTPIVALPIAPFIWTVTLGLIVCAAVQATVVFSQLRKALTASPLSIVAVVLSAGVFLLFALAVTGLVTMPLLDSLRPRSPALHAAIAFFLMWVAILGLVPLAPALGLTGLIGASAILGTGPMLSVVGTETHKVLTSDGLSVLPLFLLMGTFAAVSGVGSDIYKLAHALIGHRRGGLAHATILGCGGFGALTGSSIATAATIGRVALPEMRQQQGALPPAERLGSWFRPAPS